MSRPSAVRRVVVVAALTAVLLGSSDAPVTDRFHHCLRLWVDQSYQQAIGGLYRLHRERGTRAFWVDAARELASDDIQALVPIIAVQEQLHAHELYRWAMHRDQKDRELARSAKRTLILMMDDYLRAVKRGRAGQDQAGRDEAQRIVSRFWSCVAVRYRTVLDFEQAAEALQRAVNLDPNNTAAIHMRGAIEEKVGRFGRAAGFFEQLLEIAADHHEARLRLGLARLRQGEPREGTALLEEVAQRQGPAWVRIVAFQELVRYHAEEGRHEAAVAWARQGLELFPDNERLALQLLFLLDDRAAESTALLESLTRSRRGPRSLSPRARYNEWPDDMNDTLRLLQRDVDQRVPLLAAPLQAEEQQP